jgi:hypothetical protein
MFKAKVSRSNSTFHFWEPGGNPFDYVAICNPGLIRAKSELFDARNKDKICKICAVHKPDEPVIPAPAQPHKRGYEYKFLECPEEIDVEHLKHEFDALGKQGWILCSQTDFDCFIFMRAIQEK